MSPLSIALLGAVAGLTIFLGLPLGRMRSNAAAVKTALNAVAPGILLFLLWDVLSQAWEPVDAALGKHDIGTALVNGLLMMVCVGLGLLSLIYVDRHLHQRTRMTASRAARADRTASEQQIVGSSGVATMTTVSIDTPAGARQLALTIAIGIGLHNFAEGLAIGTAAAQGQLAFAVLLIIGFGLHNATEGFGIVAPLAGTRPSWGYLALLGLIGGGPTFLGTIIGQAFSSDIVSIAFLGLAAGSILYVVIELLAVARRSGRKTLVAWCVFAGLFAGFLTDAIVTAGGA